MKLRTFAALSMTVPACAFAQSSITLYGIIDEGLNYTSNQLGSSNIQLASGFVQGSRFGFRGQEDLGNKFAAIFTLETGYDLSSGKLGQGGRMFGRQAYVGLRSPWGSVTFGRQYESMLDFLYPFNASQLWGGALFYHANDVDNLGGSVRFDNSVKFRSVNYRGLSFGGMYAFGGVAGSFGNNSAWSAGVNYIMEGTGVGAAYTHINHPATAVLNASANSPTYTNVIYGRFLAAASSQDIWGVGASVQLERVQLLSSYTRTTFHGGSANRDVIFDNAEASVEWTAAPDVQVVGAYTFTLEHDHGRSASLHYHELASMADYFLSKRTDLYLQLVYQISSSSTMAQLESLTASSTAHQVAVRLGFRHRF